MKKRIAIINSEFEPVPAVCGGAVEMLTTYLIEANEREHRYNFDVYTIDHEKLENIKYSHTCLCKIKVNFIKLIIQKVIHKVCCFFNIKENLSFYNQKVVKKLLQKEGKYDYLLFENAMDLFAAYDRKSKGKEKKVVHLHNDLNSVSKTSEMAEIIGNHSAKIITVSDYIKESFLSASNCNADKCEVLYNCMDLKRNMRLVLDIELKKKYGFKEDDYVFIYIGRLNQEKGILELAKAFSRFTNKHIKLLICGGTWGTEFKNNRYLQEIKHALGKKLEDTIFTGYIEKKELEHYYSIANAVVIPSICEEAFGMVMLEGAYYGKPIIAAKSGGMKEILSCENALFVEKNEDIVSNLFEAMKFLSSHVKKGIEIGNRAKKEIMEREEFDKETYFERFSKIIDSLE